MHPNICIVGSGNIATFYGDCFVRSGFTIHSVVSRNKDRGVSLSNRWQCLFGDDIYSLPKEATICLLALPDTVLLEYKDTAMLKDKIVLYAAGSVSIAQLNLLSPKIICCWPVYSINKEVLPNHRQIPLLVQTSTETLNTLATQIAHAISDTIYEVTDEQKKIVHLTAVLSNNYMNHLATRCEDLLTENHLSVDLIKPIIQQTLHNIQHHHPVALQTGPAIRQDETTIQTHLELLHKNNNLKHIYEAFVQSIQEYYKLNK